jgi:hypothetical protein
MAQLDPALRITYNRREATTVALAAAEHGVTPKHMAITLDRLKIGPLPHATIPGELARLDGRTLLYPAAEIRRRIAERPGRGAPGVPRRRD